MPPGAFLVRARDVPQAIFASLLAMLVTQAAPHVVIVFHVIPVCLDMQKFQHQIATAKCVLTPIAINAALTLLLAHIALSPGTVLWVEIVYLVLTLTAPNAVIMLTGVLHVMLVLVFRLELALVLLVEPIVYFVPVITIFVLHAVLASVWFLVLVKVVNPTAIYA